MGWQPRPAQQDNDMAVVGLCCSLGSAVLLVILAPFTFGVSMVLSGPLGIGGLTCGLIAKQRADRGEAGGRGMAQAAFVLGIVALALHVLAVIAGIVFVTLFIHALDGFDIPAPDGPGPNTGPSP